MGYTVKWVEEHLVITRKALRNYEEKKLMQADESRNPINNYREYTDEDIERLWAIKVLQGIGFTVREIKVEMTLSGRQLSFFPVLTLPQLVTRP